MYQYELQSGRIEHGKVYDPGKVFYAGVISRHFENRECSADMDIWGDAVLPMDDQIEPCTAPIGLITGPAIFAYRGRTNHIFEEKNEETEFCDPFDFTFADCV